eukprot:7389017-Ditylum_brightwellii.AAC.1
MPSVAQLKDHVPSDVNRQSLGKVFVAPMCQNAPMKVTCSSTNYLCTQKLTVPCVQEDQSCTSSTPLTTNRNNNEEQVSLESCATRSVTPRRLDFENNLSKVVV